MMTTFQMQKDKQEMTTNDNYSYEHEITTDDDDKRKQHTCFHPPQFRRGWFWRRDKKASRRSKFTPLIFFEWHFYLPSRPQSSRRSRPGGRRPPETQTETSKARRNSCGRFPGAACCGNFPREFHHKILEGRARGGPAVPWDIP